MPATACLIGLDFGSASARGVLVDVASGTLLARAAFAYPHGTFTEALPDGTRLPPGFALQEARDYTAAAAALLDELGRGRHVEGIGLGFTASSPLPTTRDGTPLSSHRPDDPHAYVKLWKHSAQDRADAINARGGAWLEDFGGRLSGEWLIPKAAEIAERAPATWAATERFIEAGDWLVWQLTGNESRSLGLAAFKAQYAAGTGYPSGIVEGLASRLGEPLSVGSAAGTLSGAWRARTGIQGDAVVAVAVIDSHVVLPAIGATRSGCLVSALGTSAVHLALADARRPLPPGIEGMAFDGSMRGLWCLEAGQAGFGDALAWFVRTFARAHGSTGETDDFGAWERDASRLPPGGQGLVALDWFAGNRVPHADSSLSGLLIGLTLRTTPAGIYRALLESLCFGARCTAELFEAGGVPVQRHLVTSGLAGRNALLVQTLADVLGHDIELPEVDEPTALGAAIHGAVAAGTVADYDEGAQRFGARNFRRVHPDPSRRAAYEPLYAQYSALARDATVRYAMHALHAPDR